MTDKDHPDNTGTPSSNDSEKQHQSDVWTSGPEVQGGGASRQQSRAGGSGGKTPDMNSDEWQRDIINRLAFASLNEQRRSRRWSIFFRSLLFMYLFALLFYFPSNWEENAITTGKHTALIDLDGEIAANSQANADTLIQGLRDAFKSKNTVAVILRANSPGGSPVQAGYVYDEIKRLRKKYPNKKLYAVVTDMCASGCYYIASAADEIYADKASIVGSIGVLMNGFGFVDAMKKVGVERRLFTAGKHKGILDPFSPLKKDEVAHVKGLLESVHQQFINKVKEGRGKRLSKNPDLFTGLFWNGEEAVKLGLVDGLGSSSYVARKIIGVDKIVDYTPRQNYLDRFAERIGAAAANVVITTMGLTQLNMR